MDKRPHPLSLDLLRGFRAAARHLSFTRAAQELFVTQSAISREIKTLEEQIGKPLFRRVHRALELTRAGEELYRATDEALGLLDAVTTRLAESGKTLAVTTTTALASLWLAPRLPRFSRLHPGIDVRIAASNDNPDLEREQMDIAIRFVPVGADTPSGERLLDCDIFPVCSPALARDGARPLRSPAELSNHVRLDFETIRDGRPWSKSGRVVRGDEAPRSQAGEHAMVLARRPGDSGGDRGQRRRDGRAASPYALSSRRGLVRSFWARRCGDLG